MIIIVKKRYTNLISLWMGIMVKKNINEVLIFYFEIRELFIKIYSF